MNNLIYALIPFAVSVVFFSIGFICFIIKITWYNDLNDKAVLSKIQTSCFGLFGIFAFISLLAIGIILFTEI